MITYLLFSSLVRAETRPQIKQTSDWFHRMYVHALAGNDVDEDPHELSARYEYRPMNPLVKFPRIELREVGLVRTDARARDLSELSMDPLLLFARGWQPGFRVQIHHLLQMLDVETHELVRAAGKLKPEHFLIHPLTRRLLEWLPDAGGRELAHPVVYYAQAARILHDLLKDRTSITCKGTYWAVLDASIRTQREIRHRFSDAPATEDEAPDRRRLTLEFEDLRLLTDRELMLQADPIFENHKLCGLRLAP